MNAVATADVPRGNDTFGGLAKDGETPEQALRRLEKSPKYSKVIGSDDGQRLLAAATAETRGGRLTVADREVQSLQARGMDLEAAELQRSIEARTLPHAASATLEHLPISAIDIGENVRVDAGDLEDLVASIADVGVLQPVRAIGPNEAGRYRLVWGQRRYLASVQLGLTHIPALVEAAASVDAPGATRSIEQLAENLIRKDLNAIEEATAIRTVLEADPELTQVALATRLGRSPSWLSNTLRLLEAAPEVRDAVRAGTVTASHAKALVVLPAKDQASLVDQIRHGMSSHRLEGEIQWRSQAAEQKARTAERTEKQIPKAIAALEAAGVAKDVQIAIAHPYNLEGERIDHAVKNAGWKVVSGVYGRGREAKCDCNAVRLEFNRKWVVEPACVDYRHGDRQRNFDHVADEKRAKAIRAKVEELAGLIEAALARVELPPVLLLLMSESNYHGLPDSIEALDPATVRAAAAAAAHRFALVASSEYVWGDEQRAKADARLDAIVAAFPDTSATPR